MRCLRRGKLLPAGRAGAQVRLERLLLLAIQRAQRVEVKVFRVGVRFLSSKYLP